MLLQKSRFLFGLALLLLFAIYVPSSSALAQERWNAVVVKITDGDTVWVSVNSRRVKLRLLGIDTPEKYKGRKLRRDAARCGISQAAMVRLGREATREARTMLYRGERVRVAIYGRGYYGRTLALIYLPDGSCYNDRMVSLGYACVYRYRGHKSRELPWDEWRRLNKELKDAEISKRGLWRERFNTMRALCRE